MTAAPTAGGVVTSGVGVAGVGVGLLGMLGPVRVVHVGSLLPLSGVHIELDRLGGFFMALTGAVAAPVGCYLIGYVRREHLGRVPMAVVPLFVAAMLLVPAAGSVTTFLLAWELMAIGSLILVLSEHARPQVRSAGLWYAVMTQLGFIAILVGLVVLAAAGGSDRFAGLGAVCDGVRAPYLCSRWSGLVQAGLVPLHAWLPRAHPEAPSPVSALIERGDGQPGHLRHRPFRSAAAGAGPTLVGACAAGRGRHVRAVWGAAGFGGRRSQTAAGLFDDREHGPDHAGARCGNTFRGYRSLRAGVDRRRRSDAAHDCARGV